MVTDASTEVFREITPGELADRAASQIDDIWEEIARVVMLIRLGRAHWSDVTSLLQQIDLVQAELRMAGLTIGLLSPWMHDAVSMASASVVMLTASPGSIPRDADGIRRLLGTLPESERQELIAWMSTRRGFDVAQWRAISAVTRYSPATAAYKFPRIEEGVRFLADRNVVTVRQWEKLAAQEKVRTVYLPGANKSTVNKLRAALSESFRDGESLADFRKRIIGVADASKFQVETLFRTQTKQAYLDGVTTILENPRVGKRFPAVLYQATRDNRTRQLHADWDGKIIGVDTPEYTTAKAMQSEYNCRCTLIPLTEKRAKELGWTGGSIQPPKREAEKPKPKSTPTPESPTPVAREFSDREDVENAASNPETASAMLMSRFSASLTAGEAAPDNAVSRHAGRLLVALDDLKNATGLSPEKMQLPKFVVVGDNTKSAKGAGAYYDVVNGLVGIPVSRGAGSIAHEWAHSIDYSIVPGGEAVTRTTMNDTVVKGLSEKQKKIAAAIGFISYKIGTSGFGQRMSRLTDSDRAYWSSPHEMFARAMDKHIQAKLGGAKTYLVRGMSSEEYDAAYWPSAEETAKMNSAFEALFKAMGE